MDIEYQPIHCQELNTKILLVKLPDGTGKKFFFNTEKMSFEPLNCSDCDPIQMDSDLTPRHTEWCPHTRNTVVFAYNNVLKMELKYRFDCESGSFHEIECHECTLNREKTTDPKQIVLVATSPKSKRAIVLTMNKEGRMQKMQYDEQEKKYVDMEATAIKSLPFRSGPIKIEEEEKPIEQRIQSERDLLPLYREKSTILPNTDILIAKNMITGELGMYVFDRYMHQFLQVVLPDLKFKEKEEYTVTPSQKLIFLTMSTKDQQGISIQQVPGKGGLKKYQYNRATGLFDLMEELIVIEEEEEVEKWINTMKKDMDRHTQMVSGALQFWGTVKPFMVKKKQLTAADIGLEQDFFDLGITAPSNTSTSTDTEEEEEEDDTDSSSSSSSESSDSDDDDDEDTDSLSDEDSFEMISDEETFK